MISKGEKTPELHTASHRKIERLGLGKITVTDGYQDIGPASERTRL